MQIINIKFLNPAQFSLGLSLRPCSHIPQRELPAPLESAQLNIAASGTYVLFALACAAAYFWSTICVPETRGRSLEEMDALFNTVAGTETAQRKQEVRWPTVEQGM